MITKKLTQILDNAEYLQGQIYCSDRQLLDIINELLNTTIDCMELHDIDNLEDYKVKFEQAVKQIVEGACDENSMYYSLTKLMKLIDKLLGKDFDIDYCVKFDVKDDKETIEKNCKICLERHLVCKHADE